MTTEIEEPHTLGLSDAAEGQRDEPSYGAPDCNGLIAAQYADNAFHETARILQSTRAVVTSLVGQTDKTGRERQWKKFVLRPERGFEAFAASHTRVPVDEHTTYDDIQRASSACVIAAAMHLDRVNVGVTKFLNNAPGRRRVPLDDDGAKARRTNAASLWVETQAKTSAAQTDTRFVEIQRLLKTLQGQGRLSPLGTELLKSTCAFHLLLAAVPGQQAPKELVEMAETSEGAALSVSQFDTRDPSHMPVVKQLEVYKAWDAEYLKRQQAMYRAYNIYLVNQTA